MSFIRIYKSAKKVFLLVILFFSILIFKAWGEEPYDLIKNAEKAKWSRDISGERILPFGGDANDKRGYARYLENVILEDGLPYSKVLQTHPEWKNHGIIRGLYDNITVPQKARLLAKVGFQQGAEGTDGVIFKVIIAPYLVGPSIVIASKKAFYDGKLDTIEADLSAFAGQRLRVILQVEAGSSSGKDWAVWAEATIMETVPQIQITPKVSSEVKSAVKAKEASGTPIMPQFKPILIKKIPLIPVGVTPVKYQIQEYKTLSVDEPVTLLKTIYKDLGKPNTFYFMPTEINLVREASTGDYRISAVWTQQQKIRTTLTLKANIDPLDVKVFEEKLRATESPSAVLQCIPYEEANIIDMKGWEDWEIEDIRLPSFGSLETEMPISISMNPETLAQLKPLLEKEGLTATMSIKTGEKERAIPIRVGLKYFTGRMYSSIETVNFNYDELNSLLTIYNITNYSDFPIKIKAVNLRFKFSGSEELYKNLRCQPEIIISPYETKNIKAVFTLRGQLLAEYRKSFPPPSPKPKKPILKKVAEIIKEELEKKSEQQKQEIGIAKEELPDPNQDIFFKTYLRNYWLEIIPDFDCQPCLDKIWDKIEVVSYIERMKKVNTEILSSVFDSQSFDPPLEIEKIHLDIRSPYLSARGKELLIAGLDFNKEKLKDSIAVYFPKLSEEEFYFEYRIKVILKTGEFFESPDWERITDTLDLTIGPFQIIKLWKK